MLVTKNPAAYGMPSASFAPRCNASFGDHVLTQGGGVQPRLPVEEQLRHVGPDAPRAPICSPLENLMNGLTGLTLP